MEARAEAEEIGGGPHIRCFSAVARQSRSKQTRSASILQSLIISLSSVLFLSTDRFNMAAVFEPSLSTSIMRPPLSSAAAPSMADSLPNIDFGFEDLRQRMASFTDRFDAFIERGRRRVLEERNKFRMHVAELHGMFYPCWSDYV